MIGVIVESLITLALLVIRKLSWLSSLRLYKICQTSSSIVDSTGPSPFSSDKICSRIWEKESNDQADLTLPLPRGEVEQVGRVHGIPFCFTRTVEFMQPRPHLND